MAPTSAAERKRKSRAKKKEELGLEEYRNQQRQYIANYRSSRTVTSQQREKGDKVHVFRKQSTEPSTQEDQEVSEPVNTEKEDEDIVVRIASTSFQPRDWCLIHLKTSNTRYIAQLLTEAPAHKNHFEVDYYKVVPLTGNTTFVKCRWPDEDPVHIGDLERKVDPPTFLKGGKVEFPKGLFDGLRLK